MNEPLLSICIPTYERSIDLCRCLNSIYKLPKIFIDKIEVCVSDNCSNYNFDALICPYVCNGNLVYQVNEENIGFDRNLLEVIGMASGTYIMLLGNDDMIIEKGIIDLVNILERLTPDAVFSNYNITFSQSNKRINAYNGIAFKSELKFNWILRKLKEKITFISSITIKKNCLPHNINFTEKFIDKNFIHIFLVFESLIRSHNIVYSPYPIVNAFDNNKATYNVKKLFIDDLGFIINSYSKSYKKTSIFAFKLGVLKHVVFSKEKILFSDLVSFKFLNINSLFYLLLSKKSVLNKLFKIKSLVDIVKFNLS